MLLVQPARDTHYSHLSSISVVAKSVPFVPRSDIYGLGALAYYLLTGRSPFAGRPPLRMLAAHQYEPAAPPRHLRPDLPPDLEAVVLRCLAKDPAERYPDAESLEAALIACPCAGSWSAQAAESWWRDQPDERV